MGQSKMPYFFLALLLWNVSILSPFTPVNCQGSTSPNIYEGVFHLNASFPLDFRLADFIAENEALVRVYCRLFSNSTNNVTLFIDNNGGKKNPNDPSPWNISQIPLNIGQNINLTVTNGVTRQFGEDVADWFELWVIREQLLDKIWGSYSITILDPGWYAGPAFTLIPTMLAILFLIKCYQKKNHRILNMNRK